MNEIIPKWLKKELDQLRDQQTPSWLKESSEYAKYFGRGGRRITLEDFYNFLWERGGNPKRPNILRRCMFVGESALHEQYRRDYLYDPSNDSLVVTWDGKWGNLVGLIYKDPNQQMGKSERIIRWKGRAKRIDSFLESNPKLYKEIRKSIRIRGDVPRWYDEMK